MPPESVPVIRALAHYVQNLPEETAAPERVADAIDALVLFWSGKDCSHVQEDTCRAYTKWRMSGGVREALLADGRKDTKTREKVSRSTARRELTVMKAALRRSHGKILKDVPPVWLPAETDPRPDWLTRDQFAALLWELWKGPRPRLKDGSLGPRQDRTKHAARIALCQFYSGSRPGTVGRSTWRRRKDGPWIDMVSRTWHRKGEGEPGTVKARGPHSIPYRLYLHLERWRRIRGGEYVVEHPRSPGRPVIDIGKALATAADAADVGHVTPHTLKHTAITLAIQSGMTLEDASEYFSTSPETIRKTYWHHSPHHQQRAVALMGTVGRGAAQIRPETTGNAQK
ncbi:hypothetical protein [Roseovarius indicus]|uniref:hypothetical protein n=1 Tax=Roseovarius indicus TaxID=540747 RepID=UPI00405A0084